MIYLDYNATTPVASEVLTAMLPYFTDKFYNPSSSYPEAQEIRVALSKARSDVATLLGTVSESIIWTSGGTESNNWALTRSLWYWGGQRRRILISAIEHPSVMETALALQKDGAEICLIPVNGDGMIRLEELDALLDERTALVSVMLANNEIGTIQPIAEVAQRAHRVGALVHTDASQAIGKIPVNVSSLDVDMLTVAGHKVYAPKGIGALFIRPGLDISPWVWGGGQEHGKRSGTENVPGIIGLGVAAQLANEWLNNGGPSQQTMLRDQLQNDLMSSISHCHVFGHPTMRLPNTLAFAIEGWTGAEVLAACPELRAGTGSACHSLTDEGAPTLRAMGFPADLARGLVRISLGRQTTAAEISRAAYLLVQAIKSRN